MPALTVTDVMTQNPVWCSPHDSIDAVARMMTDADCGALPVVEDPVQRRLVGIVTTRDIVRRVVATGRSGLECTAGAVMTPNPLSLHAGATLEEAERIMEEARIRRIPIVDDRGRLIGIIAQEDLTRVGSEAGAATAAAPADATPGEIRGRTRRR